MPGGNFLFNTARSSVRTRAKAGYTVDQTSALIFNSEDTRVSYLVVTRRAGETIRIGDDIEVTVLQVNEKSIKIGVRAPREIPVHRKEIYDRIKRLSDASLVR
jgi:carbon storage regulator